MGKFFDKITPEQAKFIRAQKMFFVATAAPEGTVNVSPKGTDSFRILNEHQIAWLNLTGSGNETSAHVQINPRMTIMFCAFEGSPLILRLYGNARVLHIKDPAWSEYASLFPEQTGARQIFILDINSTQNSCGTAVPLYDYQADREGLLQSAERRGKMGIQAYWEKANQESNDGYPTNIMNLSGLGEE